MILALTPAALRLLLKLLPRHNLLVQRELSDVNAVVVGFHASNQPDAVEPHLRYPEACNGHLWRVNPLVANVLVTGIVAIRTVPKADLGSALRRWRCRWRRLHRRHKHLPIVWAAPVQPVFDTVIANPLAVPQVLLWIKLIK